MKDYEKFLKKQNPQHAVSNSVWNISNIEAGFEKFYEIHGRYPSGPELDTFEYLPSSKTIERKFGGIQKLRKELNLEHEALDYTRGKIRSEMAGKMWARSSDDEEEYYKYLITKIPELYIHEHKVLRCDKNKTDTDFFIYYPTSNKSTSYPDLGKGIAIDIFYAVDILSLLKQVQIKQKKYAPMSYPVYFLNTNKEIPQGLIDSRIFDKKDKLPQNIKVCNIDYFNSTILPKITSLFK